MEISAAELGELLNGEVVGDPSVRVHKLSKIEEGEQGALSFLANPKYEAFAYDTKASILIVNADFEPAKDIASTLIKVDDAYSSFAQIMEQLADRSRKSGVHPTAFVAESANVSEDAYIGPFCYVGEGVEVKAGTQLSAHVTIGDGSLVGKDTLIYAGVHVYHGCQVGDHCIIHAGTVIGSDGFGFVPQPDGRFKKVPQLGTVIIEDHVEIGANVTIDRGTMDATRICEGVKLDNLIQVAHNVEIGAHTVIAAQAGVSGSTKLGKHCMVGGQVGFVGHISIAAGSKINAQSGVAKSIKEPNKSWNGSPAFAFSENLRSKVYFKRLPELVKRIDELEKALAIHQNKK